jgi:hypothetical protein
VPRVTDSDLNKVTDKNIVVTELVDCPECDVSFDGTFVLSAKDQDGLTDVDPEQEYSQTCPSCSHVFDAPITGWMNYGDAG